MSAIKKEEISKPAAIATVPERAVLIAAALDMNDKMGLDPQINTKLNTQAIVRDILKNAHDLDHTDYDGSKKADEQITDATKKTLKALGFKTPKAAKTDDSKSDKSSDSSKPSGAKVKSSKVMKVEKAAKQTAKKEPKYGRIESIADVIAAAKKKGKPVTFKQLMDDSAKLYAKNNGLEYKEEYGNTWLRAALCIQVALGAAKLEGKNYTFL